MINETCHFIIVCSICCFVNVRSSERHSIDIIAAVLRWSLPRSNARNIDHDSNSTIHTNTSRSGHGTAVDALSDGLRHICINQLRWICYLGKYENHNTRVKSQNQTIFFNFLLQLFVVEYWCCRPLFALVTMGSTEFTATNSSESRFSNRLPDCNCICNGCSDDRKPS